MKSKTLFIKTQTQNIPKNWILVELQQISNIIDSLHVTPKYSSKGISMVRSTDIKSGNLNLENTFYVSEDVYEKFTKNHKPIRNDIVMSRVGTYFPNSFTETDQPFCLGQNTLVIHPLITPRFLYYALNSKLVQGQIDELLVGSGGQKTISLKDIRELLILKPKDPHEIELISKILSVLDSKIENLQKQNKILEQMAQAIFQSWFVDFDGVTEFEDSELGKIPKEWSVGNLGDICEIIMGSSPPGKSYNEVGDGILFFQGKTDFGDFFPIPRMYCTMPKKFAEKNDVLFTVRAPVGSINVAKEKYCIGRGLASLRLKVNHGCFLYFFLKYLEGKWNEFEADGTVFGSINKDDLSEFKLVLAPIELRIKFNNIIKPFYNLIWENSLNHQSLTKTRDILLPKLMSGEIRV